MYIITLYIYSVLIINMLFKFALTYKVKLKSIKYQQKKNKQLGNIIFISLIIIKCQTRQYAFVSLRLILCNIVVLIVNNINVHCV